MRTYVSDGEIRILYIHNLLHWLAGGVCDDFVRFYDKTKADGKLTLLEDVDILLSTKPKRLFFKGKVLAKNPDGEENSKYGRKSGHIKGGSSGIDGTAVTYNPKKNYWILMR